MSGFFYTVSIGKMDVPLIFFILVWLVSNDLRIVQNGIGYNHNACVIEYFLILSLSTSTLCKH